MLQQYVEERSVTPLALNYDFALITLSNAAPKGTTYLDIAAGDGTVQLDLTTAGYPADKAGQDMWTVGRQWDGRKSERQLKRTFLIRVLSRVNAAACSSLRASAQPADGALCVLCRSTAATCSSTSPTALTSWGAATSAPTSSCTTACHTRGSPAPPSGPR